MEQGRDLSASSSGRAEWAAQVPGRAQSCLLWGKKTISSLLHPGKTSSGNEGQREQVFRVAEEPVGPAPRSGQGHQLLPAELQPSVGSPWGGESNGEGAPVQQPPPRDPSSPLSLERPGRSQAASSDPAKKSRRREHSQAEAAASAPTAPCRGAQGSTCPLGSPGPHCGNQVSPGPHELPQGVPASLLALLCRDGLLSPSGISLHCVRVYAQVTLDPV